MWLAQSLVVFHLKFVPARSAPMRARSKQAAEIPIEGQVAPKREPLFPPTTNDDVYGCLKWDGPPKTLEEMDEGITTEVLARHARGRY